MIGAVVQIFDETDPLRSDTTLLVASLLSLGVKAAGADLFHITREMVRGSAEHRAVWSLRSKSEDQRFDTAAMQTAWNNGPWLLANPTHPLAILRGGLTYQRTFGYTPHFTLDELTHIETPDTWLEAGMRNLVWLLREMPRTAPRGIVRFGPRWAACVPTNFPDDQQTRLLKYVENPGKRPHATQ